MSVLLAACTAFALWTCDGPTTVHGQAVATAPDTIVVRSDRAPVTVRLYGVRAPVPGTFCRGQLDAKERECVYYARDQLASLLSGNTLDCRLRRSEGQSQALGICRLRNTGTDISFWMIARGLARSSDPQYDDAEREARRRRLGMWAD